MKFIRSLNEQQNVENAVQRVYENVSFPTGFIQVLQSLSIENLIEEIKRTPTQNGFKWCDSVKNGGICLETSKHPNTSAINFAGTVTIIGIPDALRIVDNVFERHNVIHDGKSSFQQVLKQRVQYHDTLNPKFWDDKKMLIDVQNTLKRAGQEFYDYLLEDVDFDIEDMTVTGSSANYNWTSASDLDIHLIVDVGAVEDEYGPLVSKFFETRTKLWNEVHSITIKGVPIEFYVQDTEEEHDSTGVYSLKSKKWILEPQHKEPEVDSLAVKKKALRLIHQAEMLIKSGNKADAIEKFVERLRTMRKAGLEECGEFSTENLVFKILRDEGYIDKLYECKDKIFDRDISIEEEQWSELKM